MKNEWFKSWFNTSYYHTLYKNRNDQDAQFFMRNITNFLKLTKESHIADLACGKGRHSIYLNKLGYKVTGGDLSEQSIKYAKQFENNQLKFEVFDMRKSYENKYDAFFNLFTSFGYFEDDKEDVLVLKNIKAGLKQNGVLVLDFLNVEKVKANLVENEVKVVDKIIFKIKREIKDGFIYKHISFYADQQQHSYTERVKFIDIDTMKSFFKAADFEITHIFGNYSLESFNSDTSNRLILVAK